MANESCYIGKKEMVLAIPMTHNQYQEDRFLDIEKRDIIALDMEGYKVKYQDGYISWWKKYDFEQAFRIIQKAGQKGILDESIIKVLKVCSYSDDEISQFDIIESFSKSK